MAVLDRAAGTDFVTSSFDRGLRLGVERAPPNARRQPSMDTLPSARSIPSGALTAFCRDRPAPTPAAD